MGNERECLMASEHADLDRMQAVYKKAVDRWVALIRKEEALASTNHSVAQVDRWEHAHFEEEAARNEVKAAKKEYEAALRAKLFGFR